MTFTRWSDIRDEHIERIGREESMRARSRCSPRHTAGGWRRSAAAEA
jgi:hypothetical protein